MILITGATGLTGSHLALYLLENGAPAIRAIFRNTQRIEKTKALFSLYDKIHLYDRINWVHADITDVTSLEVAFRGIDRVYHCAALVSFDPKDHERMRKNNIEGTANIVNFCLHYGVKKLCHVSSIAALGDLKENETTITEESEWNPEKPHTDYAISKFGAEMEIWRGQQEGLQTIIVNPGVILGPTPKVNGKSQGSGEIFTSIQNELPFYTTGSTGLIAVTDVATIMRKLMKSAISGERFTLIENNYNFREIANMIADALIVRRPWKHANRWMTAISWKIDWLLGTIIGKRRVLYKDMIHSLHATDLYSNEKLDAVLKHTLTPIETYIAEVAELRKFI